MLNRITQKDWYPILLTWDLLDVAGSMKIYMKLDLRHAYHLIRIAEGNEWKTAFQTHYRSFEWCVMPFGLTNAPAAFQHFVNDVFSNLLDKYVIIYLDDILVYSDGLDSHVGQVWTVLQCLCDNGLYANLAMCVFHVEKVEYLGFLLSPEGLGMDLEKVKVIQEWLEPCNVKDIQSFLGFANFYQRFILWYSDIVVPLTRLMRKSIKWGFSDKCQEAFDTLKVAFTSTLILTTFDPEAPIILETDASDYVIAAILSMDSSSGEIHPVTFHSRTLHDAELNYNTHDKELLVIFEAFKEWRHYLEGLKFPVHVITNHKNLEYFTTTQTLSRRQAQWSEFLSAFNMVIHFCPGKLGTKPDTLT